MRSGERKKAHRIGQGDRKGKPRDRGKSAVKRRKKRRSSEMNSKRKRSDSREESCVGKRRTPVEKNSSREKKGEKP